MGDLTHFAHHDSLLVLSQKKKTQVHIFMWCQKLYIVSYYVLMRGNFYFFMAVLKVTPSQLQDTVGYRHTAQPYFTVSLVAHALMKKSAIRDENQFVLHNTLTIDT